MWIVFIVLSQWFSNLAVHSTDSTSKFEEENYGVKYATECEGQLCNHSIKFLYFNLYLILVCKIVTLELENRFHDTGKSHEVIETGYTFDNDNRLKKKYKAS